MNAVVLLLVGSVLCVLSGCSRSGPSGEKSQNSQAPKLNTTISLQDSDTRAAKLSTAISLQEDGARRLANRDSRGAITCFQEAYQIRSNLLGRFQRDTYFSLEGFVTASIQELKHQELGPTLIELLTIGTNVLSKTEDRETLIKLLGNVSAQFDRLGMTAESTSARYQMLRLVGVGDGKAHNFANSFPEIEKAVAEAEKRAGPQLEALRNRIENLSKGVKPLGDDFHANAMHQFYATLESLAETLKSKNGVTDKDLAEIAKFAKTPEFALLQLRTNQNSRDVLSGRSLSRSRVSQENLVHEAIADLAKMDSNAFRILGEQVEGRKPMELPEKWATEEWERENSRFETGDSFTKVMGQKQSQSPFSMLPPEVAKNEETMAFLVMNVKGLLLDREFRLQKALAGSSLIEIRDLRKKISLAFEGSLDGRERLTESSPGNKNGGMPVAEMLMSDAASKEEQRLRTKGMALPQARRRPIIGKNEVQAHLPTNAVVIDFLRFGVDDGKATRIEEHYGALVLTARGKSKWISLGPAVQIDGLIHRYLEEMCDPAVPMSDTDFNQALHGLYDVVWSKFEDFIPEDTKRVYLAPDGALNLLPFATLLKNNHFLCEKVILCSIIGARDLINDHLPMDKSRGVDIWSNPDFGISPAILARQGNKGAATGSERAFLRKNFAPLEGTIQEASALENVARAFNLPKIQIHDGSHASESELAKVDRPFILHLATHGFYLRPSGNTASSAVRAMHGQEELDVAASLYRSGIALAGANTSIGVWDTILLPRSREDGILTSTEAAGLNLRGTWLVTLSACDTGSGGRVDGESLLCLQSGFLQSGAENVLCSLWRVNDVYTAQFMKLFYEKALATGDAPLALQMAQRDELWRRPRHSLRDRVKLVGPLTIAVRGHPFPDRSP
jgi:CHAT domain-containing protein